MTAHPIDIDAASIAAAKRAELDALEAELAELTTRRDVLARETEAYERFAAEIAAIRSPGPVAKPAAKSKPVKPTPATKAPAKQPAAAPKSSAPKPGAERIIDRAVAALQKAGKPLTVTEIIAAMRHVGSANSVDVTLCRHARRGDRIRRGEVPSTFELLPAGSPPAKPPAPRPRPAAPPADPAKVDRRINGHLVRPMPHGEFRCQFCDRTQGSYASFEAAHCRVA